MSDMDTKAIREKILSLAVRGQLVAQDPSDEPAHMLLERIREEKQRLIREKKIRAPKQESFIYRKADGSFYERTGKEEHCIDDELPFEIPDSWEWSRLGLCLDVRDGTHDTPKYVEHGYPLITSKNLINGSIDFDNTKKISEHDMLSINARSNVELGDILFAMIGSIGNPAQLLHNTNFSIKNVALFKKIQGGVEMRYIYSYLDLSQYEMRKKASGGVQPFVSLSFLRNYLIPVPPLAEQTRIASSIDEITSHLDCITVNQQAIQRDLKAIREKSLNMAISGQLVPQNPTDEPAKKLLDRIREEKQRLIKEKKIKAPKQESTIYRKADGSFYERIGKTEICIDEELPFTIPDSWEWARLSSVAALQSGRDLTPSQYNANKEGTPYITGASNFHKEQIVVNRWTSTPVSMSRRGDLLLTCKGTIGALAVNQIGDVHIARQIMSIRPILLNVEYMKLFFQYYVQHLQKAAQGLIPGISRVDVLDILMPIVPLREQKEIVNTFRVVNEYTK